MGRNLNIVELGLDPPLADFPSLKIFIKYIYWLSLKLELMNKFGIDMTFIVWNDSLDLQIDMIDEEHKVLINLMNKLHKQNSDGEPKETLKATLSELARYASKHFNDEEAYMASIKYQDLEVHKAIHQRLLDRISDFSQDFDNSDVKISEDFFNFLKIWVTSHIKGIDVKYANAS